MRKLNILRLSGLFALAVLLVAGCTQKPAPPAITPPPPAAKPAVTSEQPAQEPAAVKEEGMSETPVKEAAQAQVKAPAGLQRIHFDFDQFTLTSQARDILAQNADYIKAHPGTKVIVAGYCDERGSDEYNLALGQRRAQAAKSYLVSLGVSPDQLSTISYGEENPLDPAHNEKAWAENRRDEFKVQP